MSKTSLCIWISTICVLFSKQTKSHFPKRGYMDPGKCESFCLSSGFQGSVGSCNCGYIMFSKRSGPSDHRERVMEQMDNTNQELHQKMIERPITGLIPDPALAEMSTEEILEALDILERVNNSQNEKIVDDLSEKETILLLWLVNWVDSTN